MLRKLPARHMLWVSILLATLSVASQAIAQDVVLSPRSIVVNPVPGYDLSVWVDKDPSGRATPSYAVGDAIQVSVRSSQDAYVYLFSLAADGEVVQVLPNRYDGDGGDNFVRANVVRTFPPSGARYTFNVAPPNGLAKVIAVASSRPLDVSALAQFRSERDFATSNIGEEAFARALSIIVTPIPQSTWVSATALYYVGSAPSVGAYGTLQVDSDPRRGEVYVDRVFVGFTPLTYDLRPGVYDVEVVGGGGSASDRVQVRADRTTELFFSLRPVIRQGTATFVSTPAGAEVYVAGRFVGTTPTARVTFDVGTYEAEFRRSGFFVARVGFEVRRDADTRVSATLRAQTATLEISANVNGARVFVDGREAGVIAAGRLTVRELTEGLHEVAIVAPGYRTLVQDVRVRAGETTSITLRQVRP